MNFSKNCLNKCILTIGKLQTAHNINAEHHAYSY